MTHVLIGYARRSTDKQDLAAQHHALSQLGVALDRLYTDKGFTGTNRARSVLDARDRRRARRPGMKLRLGTSVDDPIDPMGKLFFNILATFAEFEADLIRLRTREGMAVARQREAARQEAQALGPPVEGATPDVRHRRVRDQRSV